MRTNIKGAKAGGWYCGFALLFFSFLMESAAGIAPSYYDGVNTSTAALLRSTLHSTVSSGEIQLGYDNTWNPLRDADESTTSVNHVRLVYGGDARSKTAGTDADGSPTSGGWNREHLFPQSFFNHAEPMRSDIHALYPCDSDINSRRSNSPYNTVAAPTYQDGFGNRATSTVFEPAGLDKGRVARAILYMDIRYEGTDGEPNLTVIDSYPAGTGAGQMAYLSTLLNWHRQYPPDSIERARNYKAYRYQQNANPFVDHPEWVEDIYGGPAWVPNNGDSLIIAGDGPPAKAIEVGSANVPVLILPTETSGQEVHLAALSLRQTGTVSDVEVSEVALWYDVDANGQVSAPDSCLATAGLSSGTANLILSHPFYMATGFNQLLITVNIPIWAIPGSTLSLGFQDSDIQLSATGGTDSVYPFSQIQSSSHVLMNSLDSHSGVVISEVFEGSQGNLKYIEFYNGTTQTLNLATSGLVLRRYTNGNPVPTNLSLPASSIAPGQLFVLANNVTDFQAAFGFSPNASDTNIAHNGNDCYDLFKPATGLLVDSFAPDRIGLSDNFAVDRVAHRLPQQLPNSGAWGSPVNANAPDGSLSPSGYWRIRTVTAANGNATSAGSPGILAPETSVQDWMSFEPPAQ